MKFIPKNISENLKNVKLNSYNKVTGYVCSLALRFPYLFKSVTDLVSQNSLYSREFMKSSQFLRGGGRGRGLICSQSLPANLFHPPWPFHIVF